MAIVPFRFVPPDLENLVAMNVWEASSPTGPFILIDTLETFGDYPDYVDSYTTAHAISPTDWFALSFVDSAGAETKLSTPMKGGEVTLVGEIVRRARERMPSISIQIITQEVEAAIQTWLGDNTDPYDVTLTATYRQKNGLTYMAIARTLMADLLMSSSMDSATVGLVAFKTASGAGSLKNIEELMTMAEADLGLSGSRILDMTYLCQTYGGRNWLALRQLLYNDQELAFTPWQPWPIEGPSHSGALRSTH